MTKLLFESALSQEPLVQKSSVRSGYSWPFPGDIGPVKLIVSAKAAFRGAQFQVPICCNPVHAMHSRKLRVSGKQYR